MTRLRLHALEIRVITEEGPYGITLQFEDGLVILRGENASGKSTCLVSILYALGLEGIYARTQESPLPESMTSRLRNGDRFVSVVESSVLLELFDSNGKIITCKRAGTGSTKERQLITVFFGPVITGPIKASYEKRDFFVRISGAAQSESGFHFFLSEILGLDLPFVPRFDAPPVPLYLECIFPFYFVDQLKGWTGLLTRMPTHFRIVDLWTSVVEFILALDIQENALREHELRSEAEKIKALWRDKFHELQVNARGLGFVVQNLGNDPTADWPPKPLPRLSVTEGGEWIDFDVAMYARRQRLKDLEQTEIPRIEQVVNELKDSVYQAEMDLNRLEQGQTDLILEVKLEIDQIQALSSRLEALIEDRRKYQDEQRLIARGSLGNLKLIRDSCPTCKQSLKNSLLPQYATGEPMKLEDNLQFIEAQIGLFNDLKQESLNVLNEKQQRVNALRQRVWDQAALLRDRRRAFRGDAQAPSTAAIRERLLEEDRIARLEDLGSRFDDALLDFSVIAESWRINQGKLRSLLGSVLSASDKEKLSKLEESMISQLRAYGIKSIESDQVRISDETYRPTRDGIDLPSAVQMSASDSVRLIWAYLVAFLEVARNVKTNHIGFIVFDEPQQHHMKEISFQALLERLSPCKAFHQQAIVATSENFESLVRMIHNVPCQVIELPDRVLQPVLPTSTESTAAKETPTKNPE